jgi:ankyrin repeat protein
MANATRLVVFLILLAVTSGSVMAQSVHEAARIGNVDQLKKLLDDNSALVNSPHTDSMTPLHYAVDAGRLAAASLLIDRGADLHAVNVKSETSLHIAALKGNAAAVKLLLAHGADVTKREMRHRTPLYLACNWGKDLETVKLLIDAGSDVNDKNVNGEIVLVSTLYYGGNEIIDLLIDRGATIPDDSEILSRVIWVTASNGLDRPFSMAVEKSNEQNLKWWGWVSMDACARGGSVAIAKSLIAKGHDIKSKNRYGVGPLHIAAENGRTKLVEFLLSKGAEIDEPSRTGKTALHFALEGGHEDLAVLLVRKGASEAAPQFPVLKGAYLGEPVPGDTPQRFAPGIVSGHGFNSEHSPAVFSPDGKEVYWTKQWKGPLLFMKQRSGVWTAPEPAAFISEYGDGEPIFSPDGKKLYFLSLRPMKPGDADDKENIWYVERTPRGWSEPKPVSPLINAYDLHWLFSVASNGTIYFASVREGGQGLQDVYNSRLVNGVYEEPRSLGSVINSTGIDHTPFIAPDESYLIYVSSRESASPGDMKFYISYRNDDGTWKEPILLDQRINSVDFALCPAVTPDGKYMFFIGNGDIYWVDAGFIEELRPKKEPSPGEPG